jgi:hypothetical protein
MVRFECCVLNACRLSQATTWWMDGTFSANPVIFTQLYTVHIQFQDEFIVQLWCLLPDKTGATYVRLFQLLQQKATQANLQLRPAVIHVDFEQAVMAAIRSEFHIEPSGCLFHFCQSVLRHLQQTGLQVAYNTNAPPEVRTWIRRLIALALVPPLRIHQAFQATVANAPNVIGRDAMHDYMLQTYVAPNALFTPQIWNCYGQKNRTTNVCEGYHHLLNDKFRRGRPDPFHFIKVLQEQEANIERRVAQLQTGAPPRKRKAAYIRVDEALDRLRDQYFGARFPSVAELLRYMDAVAHQMYDVKH